MKKNNKSEIDIFKKLGEDVHAFLDNLSGTESEVLKSKLENIKNDIKSITKMALIKSLEEEENPQILFSNVKGIRFDITTHYANILNADIAQYRERKLIGQATKGTIVTTIQDLEKILDKKLKENAYRDEIFTSPSYTDILDLLDIRRIKIASKILSFESTDAGFEGNRIGLLLYILGFEYSHKLKIYGNETEAYIYDETINKTFVLGNTIGHKTYISDGKKDLYELGELSREEVEGQFVALDFLSSGQREVAIKKIILDTKEDHTQIKETEKIYDEQKKQETIAKPVKKISQPKTKPTKKIKEVIIQEQSIKNEEIVSTETGDKNKNAVEKEESRIQRLDAILSKEKSARPWQKETRESTKNMLNRGIYRGAIVLPCSSGKTRTVTELLKIDNSTKLYLLPKNVIGISVVEDLIKWGIPAKKIIDCTNGKGDIKLSTLDVSKIGDNVIVANYRGLLNLRKNNKATFEQLLSKIKIILSDEAHRSLGTETRETIDECMSIESMIDTSENNSHNKKLHLLFTSTPKLLFKEIANYYPHTIISKTMESVYLESIKHGIESPLVLPKFRRMGPVYLTLDKLVNYKGSDITEAFFTKYANKVRVFVDKDGNPLEINMFKEYIKLKKENGGYAPGLGVCNTIEQAQRFTEYFQKQGIQARRCTGSNKIFETDLEYSDLKDFVDRGGVVFTADAITEGVNIPSLRVIMECAYTGSPARVVQSIGRITRSISDQELHHLKKMNPQIEESNLQKNHSNTVCLGPNMRWGDYEPREVHPKGINNKPKVGGNNKRKIPLKTFYDFILDSGEMGYETMTKEGDLFTGEEKLSLGDNTFYGKFKSPDLWDLVRNDIKKYSREPLDKEEEKIVIEKCKQGDKEAKEMLIRANIRFVLFKAKKRYYYYKKKYPQMQSTINDFVSAGFEGFTESINKINEFKPELGYSFISFAQVYMHNCFRYLFYQEENCLSKISGIYIPRTAIKKYLVDEDKIEENIISAIENDLPNRNEILEEGFIDKNDLRKKYLVKTDDGRTSLYDLMDTEIVQDMSGEIGEEKTDEILKKESLSQEISRSLNTLTEREEEIIRGFFGIGTQEKTLEELGESAKGYSLTRERVRQIKEKATRRLRHTSRSKLLKEYLGDPEIDGVSNLSSSTGSLQSMGRGAIYSSREMEFYDQVGKMSGKKVEILFVTGSGILATNILTFMQMHNLPNDMISAILDLNIIRVAQLRKTDLSRAPHGVVDIIEKALKEHGLSLYDEKIKNQLDKISL